jgi:integrase
VPIAAVLRDHLAEHRFSSGGESVFGNPRWVSRANDRARDRWEDGKLPVLTLHAARHVRASLWIDAGLNIKTVSTFMGHATIAITLDLYGHLARFGDRGDRASRRLLRAASRRHDRGKHCGKRRSDRIAEPMSTHVPRPTDAATDAPEVELSHRQDPSGGSFFTA